MLRKVGEIIFIGIWNWRLIRSHIFLVSSLVAPIILCKFQFFLPDIIFL